MGRLSALLFAFVLGAASVVALASCGGSSDADLLPGTTADQIESNLDQVEQLASEEDCIGAEDAVATVTAEVEELEGVDLKLKTALQEGTAKLSEVVSRCEEETSEETEPELEADVEPEVEDEEKPEKEKPEKKDEESSEPEEETSEDEGPELPPQSNGKGEEKGGGEGPAEPEPEETPSSGGVGPSVDVE
jgi:outer membrane biosynthesis protein TonB